MYVLLTCFYLFYTAADILDLLQKNKYPNLDLAFMD